MFKYPEHLRFRCEKCGLCCGNTRYKSRNILLLEHEIVRISERTSKAAEEFSEKVINESHFTHRMKKSNGSCMFLKQNLCSIYDTRPIICRFYPFSLKSIEGNTFVFSSTDECPGVGNGPLLREAYFKRLFAEFKGAMKEWKV